MHDAAGKSTAARMTDEYACRYGAIYTSFGVLYFLLSIFSLLSLSPFFSTEEIQFVQAIDKCSHA